MEEDMKETLIEVEDMENFVYKSMKQRHGTTLDVMNVDSSVTLQTNASNGKTRSKKMNNNLI